MTMKHQFFALLLSCQGLSFIIHALMGTSTRIRAGIYNKQSLAPSPLHMMQSQEEPELKFEYLQKLYDRVEVLSEKESDFMLGFWNNE